jgi:hypothetical protein
MTTSSPLFISEDVNAMLLVLYVLVIEALIFVCKPLKIEVSMAYKSLEVI